MLLAPLINKQIILILIKAYVIILWDNRCSHETGKWVTSHSGLLLQHDVLLQSSLRLSRTCVFRYLPPSKTDALSHRTRRPESPSSFPAPSRVYWSMHRPHFSNRKLRLSRTSPPPTLSNIRNDFTSAGSLLAYHHKILSGFGINKYWCSLSVLRLVFICNLLYRGRFVYRGFSDIFVFFIYRLGRRSPLWRMA